MFYDTARRDHGLPFDPFKALVAPRPIGWISTLSADGIANLAPYSFFNAVASRPDMVMFSSDGWKDSIRNIRDTGEFVCNLVSEALTDAMNQSSASVAPDVDEFRLAGLETAPSALVRPPRVAAAPAALECRLSEIVELKRADGAATGHVMAIGEVVGIHIDDAFIRDGRFDIAAVRPVARLGYRDYVRFGEMFELSRPGEDR